MKSKNYIHKWFEYLHDALAPGERHAIEKAKLQDPFLSDALDGFEQISAGELESDLLELNQRLNLKINQRKKFTLKTYLPYAAGLAILLTTGILLIKYNTKQLELNKSADSHALEKQPDDNKPLTAAEAKKILDSAGTVQLDAEKQLALQTQPPKPNGKSSKKATIQKQETESTQPTNYAGLAIPAESEAEAVPADEAVVEAAVEDKFAVTESLPSSKNAQIQGHSTAAAPIIRAEEPAKLAKGKIIDASTREPIAGAVVSSGKNQSEISDTDGSFAVTIADTGLVLVSFVGYETREINASGLTDTDNLVLLHTQQLALEEVVIAKEKSQLPSATSSQTKKQDNAKSNWVSLVYTDSVTLHAQPVGGEKRFAQYIRNNSKLEPETGAAVKLIVWIEDFGLLSEIQVLDSPADNYSQEAIRLIKEGPEWIPAQTKGVPVKERLEIVIQFQSK